MAGERDFDLVVLDVHMPGMNGFEVCRTLRESDRNRRTPIIFLTADGGEASEIRGLDAGGDEYLQKPTSVVTLERRIAAKLRGADRLNRLRESVRQWQEQASTDPLTGTRTRRLLDELDPRGSGVIMVDIDHFKRFNDAHGHGEGDECLRRVAGVLMSKSETVVRMGGEEFMVFVRGEDAFAVAAELRDGVRGGVRDPDGAAVTISVGAVRVDDDADLARAIRIADALLYQSKNERDRITCGLSSDGEPGARGDGAGRRRFRD